MSITPSSKTVVSGMRIVGIVGLFVATTFSLVYGLAATLISLTPYGGNLSIFILIVGVPMTFIGWILFRCFKKLIQSSDLSAEIQVRIIRLCIALVIVLTGGLLWKGISPQIQEQRKYTAMIDAQEQQILDQFQNNLYVPVQITCRTLVGLHDNDIQTVRNKRIQLTQDLVIKPLGKNVADADIQVFADQLHTFFQTEVSREEYQALKRNSHVARIRLNEIEAAFRTQTMVIVWASVRHPDFPEMTKQFNSDKVIEMKKKIAVEHIVAALAPGDFADYQFDHYGTLGIKVTRNGYDKLSSNPFVSGIEIGY